MGLRFFSMLGTVAVCVLATAAAVRAPDGVRPGEIRGTVTFAGTSPAGTPIDMSADEVCAEANAGRTVLARDVVVGAGGGLRDAIVFVREAPKAAARQEPVVLDQRACIYEPHVVALGVGQTLVIRNSDPTLHNVHVRAQRNREFNIGQPIEGLESRRTFTAAEVGIHVSCDIHGWMSGVIAVFDHAHFAVSGDDGAFVLPPLPAGEYVVEAWHETLGTLTRRVTVPATGTAEVAFEFGA